MKKKLLFLSASFLLLLSACGGNSKDKKESKKEDKTEQVSKQDLEEINSEIAKHLEETQGWAKGELDEDGNPTDNGTPDPDRAWSLYVHEIKYDGKEIAVQTDGGFLDLSDEDKTEVARRCQNIGTTYVGGHEKWDAKQYQKKIFTTVYNGEDTYGHSKALEITDFEWYY